VREVIKAVTAVRMSNSNILTSGFKFSQLEMKVVLFVLVKSFRFSPTHKEFIQNMHPGVGRARYFELYLGQGDYNPNISVDLDADLRCSNQDLNCCLLREGKIGS